MHKHTPEDIKGGRKVENSSRARNLPLVCKVSTVFFAEAAHCAGGRYAGVGPREGNTVLPLRVNTSCDVSRAARQSTGKFMTPLNIRRLDSGQKITE